MFCALPLLLLMVLPVEAQSIEDPKEKAAADKFLELLLKRPAKGTALERVFGYHVSQGTIEKLFADLNRAAQGATDEQAGRTWFLIGLLELQRGEDARATQSLAKASQLLRDNSLAAYHYGEALLLIGDTQRAVDAFEEALARKPAKADYLATARELGRLYQRLGRNEDALRIWNKLERDFPGDDAVAQRIAVTMAEEGDLLAALTRYEALTKTAKSENDRINCTLETANLQAQLGQKALAITTLDSLLVKLRPGSYLYDEAHRRIERIYLSSGDYAGLAEHYQRALQSHPDDGNIVLRLARTLSLQGKSNEAIEQFEAAIKRAPSEPRLRLALVDALSAVGRYRDAAIQFAALLQTDPHNPDYLVKYGQLLLADTQTPELERQQAAQSIWMKLLDRRANEAAVHAQVADLLRTAKIGQAALDEYRQAVLLAPDQPQYKEYLGEYLFQLERVDEALTVWRSLAAGSARTRENLNRLAEVMYQFGQAAEARRTMAEVCQMAPLVSQRLRYVEWLNEANHFAEALEQLRLAESEATESEDKSRVFTLAVKTYKAAGQLAERIREATARAQDASGEKLRNLALLYEADGQTTDALVAIRRAVVADPSSIDNLHIAARLAQELGRLPEAIEMRKRLSEVDRRFRTVHLQNLAKLYAQNGQRDLALSTSSEMLAGSGGATDAFRFHADLCKDLERPELRLEALRRCVQRHPRNQDALRWLASELADSFKTEQAIEVYWKVYDLAESPDKRREQVVKLAELYGRSNRFDSLISRLEIRGRESGDHRMTADMMATAYLQVRELGMARQTLETLWAENPLDLAVLSRLVSVCQQSGEIERAIELQRELLRLTPSDAAANQLAALLMEIGEVDEASQIWLSAVGRSADLGELCKQVERLYERGDYDRALALVNRGLESLPNQWDLRCCRMILLAITDEMEECVREANAILENNLSLDTPGVASQYSGPIPTTELQLKRLEDLRLVSDLSPTNYSHWGIRKFPMPHDFGCARSFARYFQLTNTIAEDPAQLNVILEQLKQAAMAPDASSQAAWDWVIAIQIAINADEVDKDFSRPKPGWQNGDCLNSIQRTVGR